MNYTVTWKPSLKKRLADIWLAAGERKAVTEAADMIDKLLRVTPLSVGESRSGTTRILIVSPLAIAYDVFEADRRVDVLAIRDVSKRM